MEMRRNMNKNFAISKNFTNAVPSTELLNAWGFEEHVFNADEARKEEKLEKVMLLPDWFFEVLGNADNTGYVIITGPRGAGKSAIRRSIADHCKTETGNDILGGAVLCISIDHDCPQWVNEIVKNPNKLSVDYFCEDVIERMIIAILTYKDFESIRAKLSNREIMLIERYLYQLEKKNPDEIREISTNLLSAYKKIMSNSVVKDWIKIITSVLGNEVSIDSDPGETEPINDMQNVISILKKCDFAAVYVLVDEIDEYDQTSGKPDFASEIIVPILNSLNLLEKKSIAFKFFIAAPVFHRLKSTSAKLHMEIRNDRTRPKPYILSWSDTDIEKMYKMRLMAYSNNINNSLQAFCSDELKNIDGNIIKYSYMNPRHMIRLCDTIIRYAARKANAVNFQITLEIFDDALTEFCTSTCENVYEKDHFINALIQYDKDTIDPDDFARENKTSADIADAALNELANLGALNMYVSLSETKSYKIIDPKIMYLRQKKLLL